MYFLTITQAHSTKEKSYPRGSAAPPLPSHSAWSLQGLRIHYAESADPPQATVSSPGSRDVQESGRQGQEAEESQDHVAGRDVGRQSRWVACLACLHVPSGVCTHGDLTTRGSNTEEDYPSLCPWSQGY